MVFGAIALSFGVCSCEKIDDIDDYKSVTIGGTATMSLSGDYFVKYDVGTVVGTDTTWVRGDKYGMLSFYNTSTNTADTIWMSEVAHKGVSAKILCNPAVRRFVAGTSNNLNTPGKTITIISGKVIPDGTKTAAGNVSDSVVVYATFSDGVAQVYRYSGFRRTKFQEDEH